MMVSWSGERQVNVTSQSELDIALVDMKLVIVSFDINFLLDIICVNCTIAHV